MVQAFYHRFKQSVPPRRHFADSSAYALDARRAEARTGSSRVPAVVLSDSVPLYRFLRCLAALGFLRRQFQPFRESFDRCQPFAGRRLAEHYTVIGAVDDPRAESSGNAFQPKMKRRILLSNGETPCGAPSRRARFVRRLPPFPSSSSTAISNLTHPSILPSLTRRATDCIGSARGIQLPGGIRTQQKKVPFHGALRYPG